MAWLARCGLQPARRPGRRRRPCGPGRVISCG